MDKKILLVNPPIYDFTAYDFWVKPYGLLSVSGMMRGKCDMKLFDFLDREHPFIKSKTGLRSDAWGRGEFYSANAAKPDIFKSINRKYKRYGLPEEYFREFLVKECPFDFVLIGTMMSYWYLGVEEVIRTIRKILPGTKIVLGGVYATLCGSHAKSLGADLVIGGNNLKPLWDLTGILPEMGALPYWEGYDSLSSGVIKLTDGCPFSCSYCSVPRMGTKFKPRCLENCICEIGQMINAGVKNIAFYDDALLYKPEEVIKPFLREVIKMCLDVSLHTPNAINARFITKDIADLMIKGGFNKIYIGFESSSREWQKKTGGKVYSREMRLAVNNLVNAGAKKEDITAYIIAGHPLHDRQEIEEAMRFINDLGIKIMLAEFSPIPGTPDGERCRSMVDLDEPLWHNKTVFPLVYLGEKKTNALKQLCRSLNDDLPGSSGRAA